MNEVFENNIIKFPNLLLPAIVRDSKINSESKRYLRAKILRKYSDLLLRLMNKINFKQGILIKSNNIYTIDNHGVILNNIGTDRYFKVSKNMPENEGEELASFLRSKNIEPKVIIDVGANFGEIALFFSKYFPSSEIFSIEASQDNFEILIDNISQQFFDTSNIFPLNFAISDINGKVKISKGISSVSSILPNEVSNNYHLVESKTLSQFINEQNLTLIDFLKVDIEGAEPLMINCLRGNLKKIKAIYMEFGVKNDQDKYLDLVNMFFDNKFKCFQRNSKHSISQLEVKEIYNSLNTKGLNTDFWFINPNI